MDSLKELGNIEFLNSFFTLHFKKFGYVEIEVANGHLVQDLEELTKNYLQRFQSKFDEDTLYCMFIEEAINRGLTFCNPMYKAYAKLGYLKELVYNNEFNVWQENMHNNPTYIREVEATNYLGAQNIRDDFDYLILDKPVRETCKILNESGYATYWSSANEEDYLYREGKVIKDKKVGYILIDPENLTDELKEKLILNGKCDFGGIARQHADNGIYYGVWAEITSLDMLCSDLSHNLLEKVLQLPPLEKKKTERFR